MPFTVIGVMPEKFAFPNDAKIWLPLQLDPLKLKRGDGNVLVVGHSNTLPEIIKALDITAPVTIGENDYDDLFVVVLGEPPQCIHLHYR